MADTINDSKQMVLTLKVTINTHCGETEEEVTKHLMNLLYDEDADIDSIERV